MKRHLTLAMILIVICSSVFAVSQDYIDGYLAGYADGTDGQAALYTDTKQSNQSTNSNFAIHYYVDEFGDATDQGYISQEYLSYGTFSNSATTNSEISWYLIASPDELSFVIFEYDSFRVKGSSGFPTEYTVSIKTETGDIIRLYAENHSDRISISQRDQTRLLSELKKGQTLKIAIAEQTDYSPSSYNLGELDCTGFEETYNQLIAR